MGSKQNGNKKVTSHIDPSLCTHLYYAFAKIDITHRSTYPFENNDFKPSPSTAPVIADDAFGLSSKDRLHAKITPTRKRKPLLSMYEQFYALKYNNPQLKTLLSLGGASVNATQFRTVFGPDKIRREFIRNTIKYLRKYRFDGLDLDWEFPETENAILSGR